MEQKRSKFGNWMRNSITARMLIVGFLLLVLLIPLEFVKSLISERAYRQEEVVREINGKWGNEVLFSGPILKIPYKTYKEETIFIEKTKTYEKKTEVIIRNAYLLPDTLGITSTVESKPLKRGIYQSVVYTADNSVAGNFPAIDFSEKDIADDDILWDKITVQVRTSNLKGIRNSLIVQLGNESLSMTPKYDQEYLNTIESEHITAITPENKNPLPFSFNLKINGSESIKFIPVGKETKVTMTSNWHSPSFDGKYLPVDENREITKDGFRASWEVFQINRQFEQQFFGSLPNLSEFGFGTKLIIPVDEYQKSERSTKYGFMVIGLTLLVFLLIQLVSKIHIHPFQYVMIGLALVMFYTLLLSISEHSTFLKAYAIAGASVLGLITIYSRAILKGFKFPLLVCTSLASLYGFIYVIIQLENYALLVGSIGLFVILALVMFASRKIDWGNES
ncbi:inner membrane protein [Ulvibacter sp. MAR_2010_11]|uniref:cell envelope integrity protein CreD n=1 Tax=Ulvibacter sp. MAR_2010_11 TaxID=1250229 RepID=UPI000C2BCCEF|nr:cell envelope integrity protein CreD [Ulvibacter sp. MAR_2010_11]PKA83605.1 inner membrane protein [Ulvibacter sp. MAR_2010_11]